MRMAKFSKLARRVGGKGPDAWARKVSVLFV